MSESHFRFEDPAPLQQQPRGSQIEAAKKLRENPGQWAVVVKCSTRSSAASMATAIRRGRTSTWQPAGDFESVTRTVDGEHLVYARYLGEGTLSDE